MLFAAVGELRVLSPLRRPTVAALFYRHGPSETRALPLRIDKDLLGHIELVLRRIVLHLLRFLLDRECNALIIVV